MSVFFALSLLFIGTTFVGYTLMKGTTRAYETHSAILASSTDNELRKMFLFANTQRLVVVYVIAVISVPAVLLFTGQSLIVVSISLVTILVLPRIVLSRLAIRRRRQINQALPDALAQIAGAMRAGATFISAMQSMVDEQKGPLGQEFGLLLREQRLGATLEEALDNLGERVQSEEIDLVICAALISQEVGGNLAEIMQRLSETIRRKLEMEGKVKALTSQGVLQGRVVSALPFFLIIALMVIEPEATRPMLYSVLGWCFLAVIILLQVVGGFMIRKIVRIEI